MKLFDTHAHLLDERFDADRDGVIRSLADADVAYVVEACCKLADIPPIQALVRTWDFIYGTAGVHPHEAAEWGKEAAETVADALTREKCVAAGEIGLDYHYDFAPRAVQQACFDEQLSIAGALRKPVVIHDREAHGDTMALLRAHKDALSGVMHCFSGSRETAKECMDLGLYIAFGGAVTFKNANKLLLAAAYVPTERLLIETDCPYMTPVPYRGKRNSPALIGLTLKRLAEIRGETPEALAAVTMENARRVFGL